MNGKSGGNNFLFPMIVMSILFFMVGFITTMNNSLIDFLSSSKWMLYLLNRLGYKTSAVLSLLVVSAGFILVYPAVSLGYSAFLISMFIVALGITLLQIVLNPYVLALGDPNEAASRLNLVGFFNSAATVAAPLLVTVFISTGDIEEGISNEMRSEPTEVRIPFLVIAGISFILCLLLYFSRLPEISEQKSSNIEVLESPYRCPHLLFGALAIFFYMGVEIGIPSFLPDRMKALNINSVSFGGIEWNTTGILAIYWGGLPLF